MTVCRVLIVDDEVSIRRLLRTTLPVDGFEVAEASDGDHSLELVAREMPHLVLLDWRLPGRGGAEVLRELKRVDVALPVIVLTAEREPVERDLAKSLGADAFLTKPFSPLELLDTIERLLPAP